MRLDLHGMARTTVRHLCPECGEGPLFRGSYALRDRCPACGLDLEGEHGAHYGGPIILGYAVSGLAGLGVFALLFRRYGYEPWITWVALASAVAALLLTFRHIKAHWTWWLYHVGELRRCDAEERRSRQSR